MTPRQGSFDQQHDLTCTTGKALYVHLPAPTCAAAWLELTLLLQHFSATGPACPVWHGPQLSLSSNHPPLWVRQQHTTTLNNTFQIASYDFFNGSSLKQEQLLETAS